MTDKLQRIRQALGLTKETEEQHARLNLTGALVDIEHEEGHADEICIETINRVLRQLGMVEDILKEP